MVGIRLAVRPRKCARQLFRVCVGNMRPCPGASMSRASSCNKISTRNGEGRAWNHPQAPPFVNFLPETSSSPAPLFAATLKPAARSNLPLGHFRHVAHAVKAPSATFTASMILYTILVITLHFGRGSR
ncbi:hypothetical protein BKA81DRAFT_383405 [Phyllosticta paracitricarpa]